MEKNEQQEQLQKGEQSSASFSWQGVDFVISVFVLSGVIQASSLHGRQLNASTQKANMKPNRRML